MLLSAVELPLNYYFLQEKPMQQTDLTVREKVVAGFYLVFTVLAFSSIEIMVSPIRNDMAPMLMNFWRFLIGTLTLLPFRSADKIQAADAIAANRPVASGPARLHEYLFEHGSPLSLYKIC